VGCAKLNLTGAPRGARMWPPSCERLDCSIFDGKEEEGRAMQDKAWILIRVFQNFCRNAGRRSIKSHQPAFSHFDLQFMVPKIVIRLGTRFDT